VFDIARILDSFRTRHSIIHSGARVSAGPAIDTYAERATVVSRPKSVLVVGLPAVESSAVPAAASSRSQGDALREKKGLPDPAGRGRALVSPPLYALA